MSKIWIFTVCILFSSIFLVLLFSDNSVALKYNQNQNIVHVYLIGDSTVSAYKHKFAPKMGWGQKISMFFYDQVIVHNAAVPGRSSKSFYEEGKFEKVKKRLGRGDYLFIQFGHNDAKRKDSKRYTDPHTDYKIYLNKYIAEAREKGAVPILVTPVERRNFSSDGILIDTHGDYPAAMKQLAVEEDVPLIDLNAKSKQLFNKLGPNNTKQLFLWVEPNKYHHFPNGKRDNTHLQELGATKIASLVVKEIEGLNIPLEEYVKPN